MTPILTIISICSGILLAPLAFLAVTTGYCMKTPWLTGMLTLGVLGDYSICSEIHATMVPELLSIVGIAHVISTVELLYKKYSGMSGLLRVLLGIYRILAWILAVVVTLTTMIHILLLP